ncbi:putative ribonuclease H-like domain-containing protein [Tanacetum coccineum]
MEQYLTHTDYALWDVIVNGDAPAIASASAEGGHAYHEGEEILKENMKESEFQWAPRNQENRNGDASRRIVPVENPANALVVQDGIGSASSSSLDSEVRDNSITELKNQLAKALKEKDDLKLKLEKFETSFMKLTKLVNSQISVNNKSGVGFNCQMNENELHDCHLNKIEVFKSEAENLRKSEILTKSGNVPVNTAKPSSPRAAISNSTTRYVNTAASRPTVNGAKPSSNVFHKSHSLVNRTFYQRTTPKNNDFKEKVNTAKHAGFGDQHEMLLTISPKRVDHTCLKDLTMLIHKADSSQPWLRHMTGNKFYLSDYQDIDGGFVAFGGSSKGGKITGKGKIRTDKLYFEDAYFIKKLKFNVFSVSQMCDKKYSVLFTETECLVLSPNFKLLDESQVLLKTPRQNNMYSFDLKNIVPLVDLTCLFSKAAIDESNLWHRRLGHINFKTMNKLVMGNLVRGLSSNIFLNDHTCVSCQKGKHHKASCKTKTVSSIYKPLQLLHMDLFGPVYVRNINRKSYYLVVTDNFSRFSWVFFLATKDETPKILKNFITGIENQSDHKVKTIKSDNGTEFKNRFMNEFCDMKGIRREFSGARTP